MTIGGAVHRGDAVALQAKTDLTPAYNNAAGQTPQTAPTTSSAARRWSAGSTTAPMPWG